MLDNMKHSLDIRKPSIILLKMLKHTYFTVIWKSSFSLCLIEELSLQFWSKAGGLRACGCICIQKQEGILWLM